MCPDFNSMEEELVVTLVSTVGGIFGLPVTAGKPDNRIWLPDPAMRTPNVDNGLIPGVSVVHYSKRETRIKWRNRLVSSLWHFSPLVGYKFKDK